MIAHSGFTRATPGTLAEWLKQPGYDYTKDPDFALPVPAPAAPAILLGHSLGGACPGFSAIPPEVPMYLHLEHLEITARAAKHFWLTIGVITGSALTIALLGIVEHFSR